ncbi:hypothetical protein M409DRAFT_64114 [Zasmidium cellare ATCC 36951]|uniref:AAA+ ATPase domain-containing protein n=1 Tax=Zasmidium cellare ATCC 36951 TaxID=1080233 RepID=A0A6A6CT60_ZASCE|nr:uncharacterized protein M409DRAFT_64114 [Zasmidium cellare ATCC 36951]KAF2170334.1 hypothetical protein M409DRAFT_64114 [Zasmidium cellare ATCC 36951]
MDSLVLDPDMLSSMRQLVENRLETNFDDFVSGKGQGLIGLLCGPPGLGKTFTAEAIAEVARRPLYAVTSGALGSTAPEINKNLSAILGLCAHWNAVLLLDEADIFLAKRSLDDLERNAIVSVFLRELEYYRGIMILTTNQPELIDHAITFLLHIPYSGS